MRRIVPFIIVIVFTAVTFLSGCSPDEVNRSEELKEVFETAQENLDKTFNEDECDFRLVSDFIESWADNGGVEVEKTSEHYIVISNPAEGDGSSKSTTVLQCAVHTDAIKGDINSLAMGLACLLGPNDHDNLRLIVTEINDGQMIGAESVSEKYLECTDFINLSGSKDYALFVSGCESSDATITTAAKKRKPDYSTAYEINLEFDKYADPYLFEIGNNYPDPITTIGNLLASAMSSGRLFEIGSFTSEAVDDYMPYKVTAVVVIDSNNIEGFQKKFESSYSTIESRFDKLDRSFVYTMDETDMPSSVLSNSTATELISFMYTLKTGIFNQDEQTGLIYSASYIKSISTKDNVSVGINMQARSMDDMNEISDNYETTAGLCNMNYRSTDPKPVWTSSDDSNLASYFSNLVPLSEGSSNIMLSTSELDMFAKKNKRLNAISYSFVKDSTKISLKNITNYLDKSRPE